MVSNKQMPAAVVSYEHRKYIFLSDKDLIAGCLAGDKKCEEALYNKFSGKMYALCLRYARHSLEAQDMLQDGLIKTFDKLNQFQHKGSLEYWIRRIMINTALKYYRKSSFQKELLGVEHNIERSEDPSVYSRLSEQELMAIINSLPEGYKMVFNLYAVDGYSHKEIAEMLSIQESTSRSQLVKARKLLQKLILKNQKVAV